MITKNELKSGSAIIRIITSFLLLLALTDQQIDYYNFLRCVVFATAIYLTMISNKQNRKVGIWIFAVIALLFNPIFPFYLGKDTWKLADLVTASIMIVSIKFINENTNMNKRI